MIQRSCIRLILLLSSTTFLGTLIAKASVRPNILWVNSEDNGAQWLSCYGSPNALTPNLDKLAAEGFRYTHCYSNSAVCAPTRTTWITGVHAISMGTQPMRSRYAIPHERIPYWPDQLPAVGYVATNFGGKNDFNIGSRPMAIFRKAATGAQRSGKAKGPATIRRFQNHRHQPARVHPSRQRTAASPDKDAHKTVLQPLIVPTYNRSAGAPTPNTPRRCTRWVGKSENCLPSAKHKVCADSTIVIYCSDHGGILPVASGSSTLAGRIVPDHTYPREMETPLACEKPQYDRRSSSELHRYAEDRLSLVGADIPDSMQGTILLGEHAEPEPAYHFSYRGRADKAVDMVQGIRTKRYLYS